MKLRQLMTYPVLLLAIAGLAHADKNAEWKKELAAFEAGKASGKLPATTEEVTHCSAWFEMLDDLSNDALGYHFPSQFKYATHENTLEQWRRKSIEVDGDSDESYDVGEDLFMRRTDASRYEFFYMLGRCTLPLK